MSRSVLCCTLFALAVFTAGLRPAPAHAWDFIYVDQMDVTLCNNGCGITLAELGWGLIVNTGTSNIDACELFATTYESASTNPDFRLTPFINNPQNPPIPPILPDEAVGRGDPMFLALLQPGETHRETFHQFIAFQVDRLGLSNGPVNFFVSMFMGGERAQFIVRANFTSGPHAISFSHAARVSSVPLPTATQNTTWGKIKAIYR